METKYCSKFKTYDEMKWTDKMNRQLHLNVENAIVSIISLNMKIVFVWCNVAISIPR